MPSLVEMLVLPTLNFIMQGIVFFSKFLCGSLPLAASILQAFGLFLKFFEFQDVDHSTLFLGVLCHVYCVASLRFVAKV